MVDNKKIKNATKKTYDGINFKSITEVMVYKILKEKGYDVKYEPIKFKIVEGFKSNIPFYIKKGNNLQLNMDKQRAITYTPDFVLMKDNKHIFIEVKGYTNDVYPYKRKLFRKYLDKELPDSVFFEVDTKEHVLKMIDIIEKL